MTPTVRALDAVRLLVCAYGASLTQTCDCKYGRDEHTHSGSEKTGCPELRDVIRSLANPGGVFARAAVHAILTSEGFHNRADVVTDRIMAVLPSTPDTPAPPDGAGATFDEWVIVELLGHRKLAGRVREVTLAGAGMLRLDVPATDGHGAQTQYIAPGSVYALHPTTEAIAAAAAARFRPAPVQRWELEPPKTLDEVHRMSTAEFDFDD